MSLTVFQLSEAWQLHYVAVVVKRCGNLIRKGVSEERALTGCLIVYKTVKVKT